MPAKVHIRSKEGEIIVTRIKTTDETPLPELVGHNFLRCKAQRGELVSEVSNVAVEKERY